MFGSWPRREGEDPDEDEAVRELSDVERDLQNLNSARRPSSFDRSCVAVTGTGVSMLDCGNVPGRGKNGERF